MTKTGKQVTQNISKSAKKFGVKSFHIGISKSTCNFHASTKFGTRNINSINLQIKTYLE